MKFSRKNLGRAASALLATAMLAAFTAVPASANPVTTPEPLAQSIDSIKINAKLMMPTGVLTPNVTFSFNIVPAGNGTGTVEDTIISDNKTIELKEGVGTVNNAGTVTYSAETDKVGSPSSVNNVSEVTKSDVELSLTGLGTFNDAGVYKYYITEGIPTSSDAGFDSNDFVSNLKLPLYIFVARQSGGTYGITGAVVYPDNATADGKEGSKTDTFVNWYQLDNTNPQNPTVKTGMMSITNTVTGAMGDHSESFEFTITDRSLVNGATYSVKYSDASDYTTCTVADGKLTLALKDSQTVTIYGLTTSTSYTVSAPDMSGEGYTITSVNVDGVPAVNTNKDQTVTVNGGQTTAVAYTFNRDAITPTGVVVSVAPYALLVVVAAAAGFVFLRKRRED